MTDLEKQDYIDAELCLQSAETKESFNGTKNRWDELTYVHLIQTSYVHAVGAFLPWHRLYVHLHEQLLRNECNYTGYQPYWEEALDADDMDNSVVFNPDTGFGGNGSGDDKCVVDGPFSNLMLHITSQWGVMDYSSYCLARSFDYDVFLGANQTNIDTCLESDNYVEALSCYSNALHIAGHLGVGKTIYDPVASPGDPLFFLHHANLDRLWWEWQSVDLSTRLEDMGGSNIPATAFLDAYNLTSPGPEFTEYSGDGGNVTTTTLNHTLWMVGLIPNKTIADVMDLGGDLICAEYV
ncbi:amino acid transporter [Diaporthe sp. PMI_573]|nr:amino acid transporter [Diaporthaceae sp. PMI_573]